MKRYFAAIAAEMGAFIRVKGSDESCFFDRC